MRYLAKLITTGLMGAAMVSVAEPAAGQMSLGFKLGPTFSKVSSSDDTEDVQRLSSFGGGGFIRFGMGGLAIQPELLVITKGAKFEEVDGTGKLKLDYIDIPVQAAFTFGTGTIAPYILIGPSFGFEIACGFEFEADGFDVDADCDDPEAEGEFTRKKFDISVTGSAGLSMRVGPGSILVEGRYIHGLTNLNDDDTSDETSKHRTYALFAGYSIPLGTR